MKPETKEIRIAALLNAAEFIRGHIESGGICEDELGMDEKEYKKQCNYVSNLLNKIAEKLQNKPNDQERI